MNSYTLTIIYAHHMNENAEIQECDFTMKTLSPEQIQVINVQEDDPYHSRRNAMAAIPEAKGSYTILLDAGDSFDGSFLDNLLQAARNTWYAFAMPWRRLDPLSAQEASSAKNVDVNIKKTPSTFPSELHALMVSTEHLQAAYQAVGSLLEPEKRMILFLLDEKPLFRYLAPSVCLCARPREFEATYDVNSLTRDWYYAPFDQLILPRLREEAARNADEEGVPGAPDILTQFLALFMVELRIRVNTDNLNKHVISEEEVPSYLDYLSEILQYVDIQVILSNACRTTNAARKLQFLCVRLKKRDYSYYPTITFLPEKKTMRLMVDTQIFGDLSSLRARVNLMDYRDGCLEMDFAVNDYFSDEDAYISAQFGEVRYDLVRTERYSLTKCFGVSYCKMKTYHISIPLKGSGRDRLLNFYLCVGPYRFTMDYEFPSQTSRFTKDFPSGYWKFGEYISWWGKAGIHVRKSDKKTVLNRELRLWAQIWRAQNGAYRDQLPLKILNFALRPWFSRQKIWMFMDKIYKGGDSSEYIYRYAEGQKDGIRKYYLLDKDSADYQRMKSEGFRPLVRGSLKHRLVFLNADLVIASNSTVCAFNDYTAKRSLPIRGDLHFEVACVQHGMSVQKIALAQQRLRDNTRLYFCASKYEIENLSRPVYDYQGYDILKLTGVPRYDGLKSHAEKILLISPTWRMNSALPVTKNEGVARDYNPNFRETSYFQVYNSLINDPRLLENARNYGYRIQYVLHPIVSPQAEDFTKNDLVEIIPSIGDMSYEKLFCSAALMVTDFSGVQFDFAYMRKPVVYLHHNDIPQHYEEGTYHYDTMSFGEICHTNDELIDVLIRYMQNGCEMPDLYRRRADDFFAFSDNENCARIYPIMLEYENKYKS